MIILGIETSCNPALSPRIKLKYFIKFVGRGYAYSPRSTRVEAGSLLNSKVKFND